MLKEINKLPIQEELLTFPPECNIPQEAIADFELAGQVFSEAGFGQLDMTIIGSQEDNTVIVSLGTNKNGVSIVYWFLLATQATYLRQAGIIDSGKIKSMLLQKAGQLLDDQERQRSVLGKSLKQVLDDLETVAAITRLQAEASGATYPDIFGALV